MADVVLSDRPFNYLVMLKFALDMAKALSFLHTYAGTSDLRPSLDLALLILFERLTTNK